MDQQDNDDSIENIDINDHHDDDQQNETNMDNINADSMDNNVSTTCEWNQHLKNEKHKNQRHLDEGQQTDSCDDINDDDDDDFDTGNVADDQDVHNQFANDTTTTTTTNLCDMDSPLITAAFNNSDFNNPISSPSILKSSKPSDMIINSMNDLNGRYFNNLSSSNNSFMANDLKRSKEAKEMKKLTTTIDSNSTTIGTDFDFNFPAIGTNMINNNLGTATDLFFSYQQRLMAARNAAFSAGNANHPSNSSIINPFSINNFLSNGNQQQQQQMGSQFTNATLFKPNNQSAAASLVTSYMQNSLLHSMAAASQLHPLNLTFATPTSSTNATTTSIDNRIHNTMIQNVSNWNNNNNSDKLINTNFNQKNGESSKQVNNQNNFYQKSIKPGASHSSESPSKHSNNQNESMNCKNGENSPNEKQIKQQTTVNGSSESSSASTTTQSNLLCVVCGDLSSGKHYGILACNGCSGFFKRSVRRKLIYRCQAGTGSCIIDKQHRNQCQACRLKKCISMGMNKDAVQNERQPRNTATIRPEVLLTDSNSERLLREGVAATVAAVFGLSNPRMITKHRIEQDSRWRPNEKRIKNANKSISFTNQNKNSILTQKENRNSSRESMMINDASFAANFDSYLDANQCLNFSETNVPSSSSNIILNSDSFYEISAALLFTAIRWTKNLPSFNCMSYNDQIVLLEESWTEIFILNAIQWSLPMENCSIFSSQNIPNSNDFLAEIRVLNDIYQRFRTMAVTATEYACLKALALFKPEARRLKDVLKIEQMQDQLQTMLLQQQQQIMKNQSNSVNDNHNNNNITTMNTTNPIRFGKLLLLLLSLKIIPADKIASIYFKKAMANTTIEQLLTQMFKC